MGVGGQRHAPAALPPGKRPGTHCIGGWVGPRACQEGLYCMEKVRWFVSDMSMDCCDSV
jgi:hypothetical protein